MAPGSDISDLSSLTNLTVLWLYWNQISNISALFAKAGVSPTHLSRIEKAQRYPSTNVLRKIAQPLGLEEKELFNLAGYLPLEQPMSPDQERHRLRAELDILLNRVIADTNRIKSIIKQLRSKP